MRAYLLYKILHKIYTAFELLIVDIFSSTIYKIDIRVG